MIAPRFTAAALALLAFCVTILTGMWIGNPVEVTLSRALTALVVFAFIGLGVGWAGQAVVREHARNREAANFGSAKTAEVAQAKKEIRKTSTEPGAEPMERDRLEEQSVMANPKRKRDGGLGTRTAPGASPVGGL